MCKILQFPSLEEQPHILEQKLQEVMTPEEAVDTIVAGMVCHMIPSWVSNRRPFHLLEIMADELRRAMSQNVPHEVHRYIVDAIIEELRPVWTQLASQIEL